MIEGSYLSTLCGIRPHISLSGSGGSDERRFEALANLINQGVQINSRVATNRLMITKSISSYVGDRKVICLASKDGVSKGLSKKARRSELPQSEIWNWLNSWIFRKSKFPLNFREDGWATFIENTFESGTSLVSFSGLRNILNMVRQSEYNLGILENYLRCNRYLGKKKVATSTSSHNNHSDVGAVPLGGRERFSMPTFWSDAAYKLCQSSSLGAVGLWTAATRDFSDTTKVLMWEANEPKHQYIQEALLQRDINLRFLIQNLDYITDLASLPDYRRLGTTSTGALCLKLSKRPIPGYVTRAIQEHEFVNVNRLLIRDILNNGQLVSDGIIDVDRMNEVFASEAGVINQSYFIYRSLELELWLQNQG